MQPAPPPPPQKPTSSLPPRSPPRAVPLSQLLAARAPPPQYTESVYHLADTTIRIQEDIGGGVGGSVWISCVALFKHLETRYTRSFFAGKRVIELGSGTGLVGIAMALLGARVVMTDLAPVLPLIRHNLSLNFPEGATNVEVKELTWGEDASTFRAEPIDVIISSECLYNSSLYTILLDAIRQLAGNETLVFVSYEPRIDREHMFFEMAAADFDIVETGNFVQRVETEIENHPAVLVCLKRKILSQ